MFAECKAAGGEIVFTGIDRLDIARCCGCGQAFRWKQTESGFASVVAGAPVDIFQCGDELHISQPSRPDMSFWENYFDLDRDYSAIEAMLLDDPRLGRCVPYATGIRVFNQEPFETLISFIISANNNIARISGIIDRLCITAGEAVDWRGEIRYTFPSAQAVAALSEDQLRAVGCGYRAPFIKKTAEIAAAGFDLDSLRGLTLDEARRRIRSFPGVGPKVADCVLLFSLGYTAAFPVDVWMRRALSALFLDGDDVCRGSVDGICAQLGEYSGIIQQYIFHYARSVGVDLKR